MEKRDYSKVLELLTEASVLICNNPEEFDEDIENIVCGVRDKGLQGTITVSMLYAASEAILNFQEEDG